MFRALREGQFDCPEPGADRILRDMWREAIEIESVYRHHYNLPSTDPRYLDATLEDMARDLLLVRFLETQVKLESGDRETTARDGGARRAIMRLVTEQERFASLARAFFGSNQTQAPKMAVRIDTGGIPNSANQAKKPRKKSGKH